MKAMVLAGGLPQITLIKKLKDRGIETVLVDGGAKPLALPYCDCFYQANIFDTELICDIARKEKVDFLITVCADQVLLVVAQVSEILGLPCYLDYATAQKVSDKELMKRVFSEKNIPTSHYVVMEELDMKKIEHLRYPIVVKPVDAYSSRGVRKVTNEEELRSAFQDAVEISRTKNAIVEEFVAGEEISVDVFVVNGEAKILCVSNSEKIAQEDKFVIFRGRYPVNASAALMERIREVAQNIADAFGIKNAPMLVQMITDGKEVSVLEFCARTGGAMKFLLIKRASGVDVIDGVIELTLGNIPEINVREPESKYIVNDFIYCKEGVFDRMEGFAELVEQGILTDYHPLRSPGTKMFGRTNSSGDRVAGMTIEADTLEEFNRRHRIIVDSVKILDTEGNDIMRHDMLPELK